VRDLRVLLRHRASLVRERTSLKNRIHAVLADEGLKVEGEKLWSDEGQQWLAGVSVRDMHRLVIAMTAAACSTPWRFPSGV